MTGVTWAVGRSILIMVLGLIAGLLLMTAPCALADSFNLKTGAWEMIHTTRMTGTFLPADILATMPPDERAKLERAMQARSRQPKTQVAMSCLTQEDLDQNRLIKEPRAALESQCTAKIVSKSPSKLVMERACPAPHAFTSRMTVEAKTPESLVASLDTVGTGSGKSHVDIKGHWLGTSCAGIKNRD